MLRILGLQKIRTKLLSDLMDFGTPDVAGEIRGLRNGLGRNARNVMIRSRIECATSWSRRFLLTMVVEVGDWCAESRLCIVRIWRVNDGLCDGRSSCGHWGYRNVGPWNQESSNPEMPLYSSAMQRRTRSPPTDLNVASFVQKSMKVVSVENVLLFNASYGGFKSAPIANILNVGPSSGRMNENCPQSSSATVKGCTFESRLSARMKVLDCGRARKIAVFRTQKLKNLGCLWTKEPIL